jgi:hypothetical protein
MKSALTLLILLAVAAAPGAAQSRGDARRDARGDARGDADRWQLTLANGEYLWDVRLVKLSGDSLQVRRGDSVATVSVGQVNELRLIRKSELRPGDAGGAMAALMGADDEVYDLTPLGFADRVRVVQKIFLYHPPDSASAP